MSKEDCILCIKRLRWHQRKLPKEQKFRYHLRAEYGENGTLRPHYHILFYNAPTLELLQKCWGKGNVNYLPLKNGGSKYVLKYINKQAPIPEGKKPVFGLRSNSLGKDYLTPQTTEYHKRGPEFACIRKRDGNILPLPKIFKEKIFNEKERTQLTNYLNKRLEIKKNEICQNLMSKFGISENEALLKMELSDRNKKLDKINRSSIKL